MENKDTTEVNTKELEKLIDLSTAAVLKLVFLDREIQKLRSKLNFWRVGAFVNLALALFLFYRI